MEAKKLVEFTARLEEEVELQDSSVVCVRIAEFYSPRTVLFPLYLRLGSGRYLCVFRAGESYDEAELRAYEGDRGIRYVYFAREQRARYIASSLALLQKLVPVPAIPVRAKFGVARILVELFAQELYQSAEAELPALVERGKEICALIASWVETDNRLEAHLIQLEQVDATTESIAFLRGLFACVASRRFPWNSRRTSETLMLSSLLADLGLSALPAEVTRLRPKRMNSAQRSEYERHPDLSHSMLQNVKGVSDNVLHIVREHHEYCDGSGFPHRLTSTKTLVLTKLTVLCGDLIVCAAENLLPVGEAVKVLFPERSEKVFTEHPEMVVRYDRELLVTFFTIFEKKKEVKR